MKRRKTARTSKLNRFKTIPGRSLCEGLGVRIWLNQQLAWVERSNLSTSLGLEVAQITNDFVMVQVSDSLAHDCPNFLRKTVNIYET